MLSRRAGPKLMTEQAKAEKIEAQRIRRLSRPPSSREKIGASQQDFDYFWKLQKGCCAICGKELVKRGGNNVAHLDHDHTTGKLRGLLCYSCNTKLGFVERFLFRIVQYLGGTIQW